MFSEMSVLTRATGCKIAADIVNIYLVFSFYVSDKKQSVFEIVQLYTPAQSSGIEVSEAVIAVASAEKVEG
jgi:hypothetical protein